MLPKLILITGAPGVGKTTVAGRLFDRPEDSGWLDGDDVWRMNPFIVNETTKKIVESNIQYVLRNYLVSGFSYVILSWVLRRRFIIDRILTGLSDLKYDLFVFTLVCDEETLSDRLESDVSRNEMTDLPFIRLRQSRELDTFQIDVSVKEPSEICSEILRKVTGSEFVRDWRSDE
ncbi:MAG: AAA family ATPase [Deltaproteobacteria bacterium]|nr:AAA family ATPase [Deltaproteobacteria bacterium]